MSYSVFSYFIFTRHSPLVVFVKIRKFRGAKSCYRSETCDIRTSIGESNKVSCSVLFVNKADYGNNFEEIEAKIKADGTLKLQKKNLYIKYSDLGKYIKRYNFLAMSELTRFASEIEIDENADSKYAY